MERLNTELVRVTICTFNTGRFINLFNRFVSLTKCRH